MVKYCYVSLTIQLKISYFFAVSLNVKQFYLTHRYDMLPLQAIVDLGAMAMKGYSAFPQSHQIVKYHI